MKHLLSWMFLGFACGCGSSVSTPGEAGATTGAGGAAATSTSSSSTAAVATSTTGSGGFTATTGAGGSTSLCDGTFIDVYGSGMSHLVGSCPNTWGSNESEGPVTYFNFGGGALLAPLSVIGCVAPGTPSPGINLFAFDVDSTTPGSAHGTVTFTDATGATWYPTEKAADIVIDKISDVTGDTVDGSFQGSVAGPGGVLDLSGTFHACKVDDLYAP